MSNRRVAKHILREQNRHGATVFYYRENHGPRYRLPDEYGTEAFWEAYRRAKESKPIPHVRDLSDTKSERRKREVEVVVRRAVSRARGRAKARGLPFTISVEWALREVQRTSYRCPETNIPFLFEEQCGSFMRPFAPSLDRKVPALGYTQENTRIIIFALNAMISDWGEGTMHRIANGYRYVQNKRRRSYPRTRNTLPRTSL